MRTISQFHMKLVRTIYARKDTLNLVILGKLKNYEIWIRRNEI